MSDTIYARGFERWTLTDQGGLDLKVLTGHFLAASPEGCLARLEYAESEEELMRGESKAVQLHMKPYQARSIAELLIRMADTVDARTQEAG